MSALSAIAVGATLAAFPVGAGLERTPSGPATLTSTKTETVAMVGAVPAAPYDSSSRVVMNWTVTVGPGGRAGVVGPVVGGVAYDPVDLPSTPGTYTFPAPRVRLALPLGLVQETGEHAIVTREACRPQIDRASDPCETSWLDIQRAGQPDLRDRGAQLALAWTSEPDVDGDLRGDLTEDRTDLRVSALPTREPDGRLRLDVTLTNAGALTADLPSLDTSWLAGARWEGGCLPSSAGARCVSPPLAPGETRVFSVHAEDPDATTATITARAEGEDLAPGDNSTALAFAPAAPFAVVTAKAQSLSRGIKVRLSAVRPGPARVTVAFTVRGHLVKLARTVTLAPYVPRTITLRATGAKLRSLRRHAPVKGEITVRTPGAVNAVSAATRVS
ncbi:hypothetical protein OM076_24350 [Solirubrobacter ginsenosidimutans]|uniref:DUF11 domain-containing protein n=1 Tax=Solirubrobacter ginsenosidimutans TaxID=490573 RepID=A0A9X3S3G6_9ACTN|nr:hypothetical protein [Solirubrobacter ginsenosidimutans]MDA0163427.1 hypothetical protein [Solirubrobacter ginsenosidimutans]